MTDHDTKQDAAKAWDGFNEWANGVDNRLSKAEDGIATIGRTVAGIAGDLGKLQGRTDQLSDHMDALAADFDRVRASRAEARASQTYSAERALADSDAIDRIVRIGADLEKQFAELRHDSHRRIDELARLYAQHDQSLELIAGDALAQQAEPITSPKDVAIVVSPASYQYCGACGRYVNRDNETGHAIALGGDLWVFVCSDCARKLFQALGAGLGTFNTEVSYPLTDAEDQRLRELRTNYLRAYTPRRRDELWGDLTTTINKLLEDRRARCYRDGCAAGFAAGDATPDLWARNETHKLAGRLAVVGLELMAARELIECIRTKGSLPSICDAAIGRYEVARKQTGDLEPIEVPFTSSDTDAVIRAELDKVAEEIAANVYVDDAGLGRVFVDWIDRDGGHGLDSLRGIATSAEADEGLFSPYANDVELLIDACERRIAEHNAGCIAEADEAAAAITDVDSRGREHRIQAGAEKRPYETPRITPIPTSPDKPHIYSVPIAGSDNVQWIIDAGTSQGSIPIDPPITMRPGDEIGIVFDLSGSPIVATTLRPRIAPGFQLERLAFDRYGESEFSVTIDGDPDPSPNVDDVAGDDPNITLPGDPAEDEAEPATPGPDGIAGEPVTDWEYDTIADRIHAHLPYAATASRRAAARDVRQWADELIAKRAAAPRPNTIDGRYIPWPNADHPTDAEMMGSNAAPLEHPNCPSTFVPTFDGYRVGPPRELVPAAGALIGESPAAVWHINPNVLGNVGIDQLTRAARDVFRAVDGKSKKAKRGKKARR